MKLEIDYIGIKLIPETYQDKYYLVGFCKEADGNQIDDCIDLQYRAGNSCGSINWKNVAPFCFDLKEEVYGETCNVEEITELLISSSEI